MKYAAIETLRDKLYFTNADISRVLGISSSSAPVAASRYTKSGLFVKCKRNHYIVTDAWKRFRREDMFKIANLMVVPSYISLLSALSFYEISSQIQRNRIESVSLRRSLETTVTDTVFTFNKLKKQLYSGYVKQNGFFIATAEKALADTLYLCSFGKYKADFEAINWSKFNKNRLRSILKSYPERTLELAKRICKT